MSNARPPAESPSQPRLRRWQLALLLVGAQCLTLLLLGFMLLNKHGSVLDELTLSRIETQAGALEAALRLGVLSGLQPQEIAPLHTMVRGLRQAEPAIAGIDVASAEGNHGRVVLADDPGRVGDLIGADEWRALSASTGFVRHRPPTGPQVEVAIRDATDELAGVLRLRAATAPLASARNDVATALAWRIAAAGTLLLLLTPAALIALRRTRLSLRIRLSVVALGSTLATGALIAWQAEGLFAERLTPAITAKVAGVASLLAGKLERASRLGIPLHQLPGIEETFADLMSRHPEISAVRLTDEHGHVIAEHGTARGDWVERAAGSTRIAVASDERFVSHRLRELAMDIVIVLLAAALVFRELLLALVAALPTVAAPPALSALRSLRLPLFLLILTEELSRAFLPLYVKALTRADGLLAVDTAVSLPMAAYMLCFAVATPFAGRATDHWGANRVFSAGVVLTVVGFTWTALATSYWQLLPARALCACGYASGTIACQRQLIALTGAGERARGLALFVGAVGVAAICGSALGGVLAGEFGFRPVLVASALLALLALAAYRRPPERLLSAQPSPPPLTVAEVRALLTNRRFAGLMFGAAVPAKLALAGLLFYLTPLALTEIGYGPAAIGRAVMLYFVLVAAVNPLASWLSDRYGWRWSLTVAGGVLIGAGPLAGMGDWLSGEQSIWLAIAALGVGTGLAAAPMQALASEVGAAAGATSVAVVLRTIERLGSAIGPLWAGLWLVAAGWSWAIAAIGSTVLAATLLCFASRRGR